jgi:hypothetical protein
VIKRFFIKLRYAGVPAFMLRVTGNAFTHFGMQAFPFLYSLDQFFMAPCAGGIGNPFSKRMAFCAVIEAVQLLVCFRELTGRDKLSNAERYIDRKQEEL